MKNIKNSILVFVSALLIVSCYEDKGNYNYKESNKITIKKLESVYYLDVTDVSDDGLELVPELEFELKELDNLTYRWSVEGEVMSNDLKFKISKKEIKKDSDCRFEVIDQQGNHFIKDFDVKLKSSFESGWLLLTEKEANNSITFIKPEIDKDEEEAAIKYKPYVDIYSTITGEILGNSALKMIEHWNGACDYGQCGNVVIIKQDIEKSIEINGSSLKKECKTKDYFLSGHAPEGYNPIDESYLGESSIILNEDGKLYSRKCTSTELFQSGKFMDDPVYFEKGLNITLIIPSLYKTVYCCLLFDKKYQRLLYVDKDGKIGKLNFEGYKEGVSHLDDLKKDVVYGGFHSIADWGQTLNYTLVLNTNGVYTIEDFKMKFETVYMFINGSFQPVTKLNIEEPREDEFNHSGLVDENSKFCRPRNRQYLYFSKNDKFYAYDLNVKEAPILLCDFTGVKITDIDAGLDTKQIGVALENGDFYIFDTSIEKIANPTDNIIYHYQGEKPIIDLMYKYGAKSNIDF